MVASTTPSANPARPMFLSADRRHISYRSKSGNVLTLKLKNSNAVDSLKALTEKDGAKQAATAGQATEDKQGLWPGLFDTLSFWAGEAVEVAFFGPYDEPIAK